METKYKIGERIRWKTRKGDFSGDGIITETIPNGKYSTMYRIDHSDWLIEEPCIDLGMKEINDRIS